MRTSQAAVLEWCNGRTWDISGDLQLPSGPCQFAQEVRSNYVAIAWAIPMLLQRAVDLIADAPSGWDGIVV
jgi:hypothetical protein